MSKLSIRKIPFLIIPITFLSCNAFMHGYTSDKAQNSYQLVTGDKNSFGDKRLKYNKSFHNNSALSNFLDCNCNGRGLPNFIYEYKSDTKCRGIKLYFVKLDSVFIFEEPKKNNLNSVLKEARKMDDYEKQTFERLKTGN
jgi:hypothetical protein